MDETCPKGLVKSIHYLKTCYDCKFGEDLNNTAPKSKHKCEKYVEVIRPHKDLSIPIVLHTGLLHTKEFYDEMERKADILRKKRRAKQAEDIRASGDNNNVSEPVVEPKRDQDPKHRNPYEAINSPEFASTAIKGTAIASGGVHTKQKEAKKPSTEVQAVPKKRGRPPKNRNN